MLILTTRVGRPIHIGDDTQVVVTKVDPVSGQVKLGFIAPRSVEIDTDKVRKDKLARGRHKARRYVA